MKLFFTTMAIVMTALLAVSIIGCGDDDDDDNGDPADVTAAFASADPADGGSVASNGKIKVTFDKNPGDVMASTGTVSGGGTSRTISGPFDVGSLALTVTWTNGDGSQTLNYTVTEADETPPEVVSTDPEHGAKDLDPAKVAENGITVTFSESVTGTLKLMEGDTDLEWESKTEGDTITLMPKNINQTLSNETDYMVSGTVTDASGNSTEVDKPSFTTKAKE